MKTIKYVASEAVNGWWSVYAEDERGTWRCVVVVPGEKCARDVAEAMQDEVHRVMPTLAMPA